MKFGFGDEAGDTGGAHGSSSYLVVAIVLTDDPQHLRRIIPRMRKGLDKKLKQVPEFKAYHTPRNVLARLLRKVGEQDVEIVAVVWRKAETTRLADPEDGYRRLCALAVRRCLERHSRLSLVLDKRYTNPKLRDLLAAAIVNDIGPQTALLLQQHESRQEQALQVADAITWAIFQKYERGDKTLYDIFREKIVFEEVWEETKNWLSLGADSHRSTTE